MKKVAIFGVLCAVASLHAMEEAFLPYGAPARLYPAVGLGHAINVLEGQKEESMSVENECGPAYQVFPDEDQKEKVDGFIPTAMFSEKYKVALSHFPQDMISAAFGELESDPDYRALKVAWNSGAPQCSQEALVLERPAAVKLFRLLACKEKQVTHNASMESLRCCCSGLTVFIIGMVVCGVGPLTAFLVRASQCSQI